VGGIVIGALGILSGLSALVAFVLTRHDPFASLPGQPPAMARMIVLQQEMMAGPAPLLTLVVGVWGLLVGGWALLHSIRLLSGRPHARVPFRRSLVALGVTECVSLSLGLWLQLHNFELFFGELPGVTTGSASAAPPGFATMMNSFILAVAVGGVVVTLGWGALKLVFLVWAHRYVASPDVVAHLDRSAV
jgi:hypothetical protein